MLFAVDHPAHHHVELAAAAVRTAASPADYLAARENLLEAMLTALDQEAAFWGM